MRKPNNSTVFFLSIQEWSTLTNYLPNLRIAFRHICLSGSQPFDLFTEEMDTHLNFLLSRLKNLTRKPNNMTAFSWYPTEVRKFDQLPLWHVKPLALSLYLKINQFDFVLCETLVLICMVATYWLVVMCDTYQYIEVSRYFENIAIRYSMLVYWYFY